MRLPSAETALTVLVVVAVLGGAGFAFAVSRSPSETVPPPLGAPSSSADSSPGDRTSAAPVDPSPETARPSPGELPSATASACPDLTRETPLRVITLNAHGGRGPAGFSLARLAQVIGSSGADVVLLQEVDRGRPRSLRVDMPLVLARLTGMELAYGLNGQLGPRRGVTGVATLSRFPITDQVNTHLPYLPGTEQRGVLRTDIDVDGTTVSFFNTHLEPGAPKLRVRQMSATLGVLSSTRHPAILGGDLNATPGSTTLGVTRTSLRDAWVDAGVGPANTMPATNPRIRIDYLLYAEPLRVTRTQVLPSLVSDHRGVLARFVLSVAGDEVCVPELDGPIGSSGG